MIDILEDILKGILEGINIKYIAEEIRQGKVTRIGADLFEVLYMFENVSATGKKIIHALESYVGDIVINKIPARSSAMEGHRMEMLELVKTQRLNIKCIQEEISHRSHMTAYVNSRSLRKLEEIVWEKRDPLRKLREYFDDGFSSERTIDYLSQQAISRINRIDGEIAKIDPGKFNEFNLDIIFSLFDLDGAKRRIEGIDKEIESWHEHLKGDFDLNRILLEVQNRYDRKRQREWQNNDD